MTKTAKAEPVIDVEAQDVSPVEKSETEVQLERLMGEVNKANHVIHILKTKIGTLEAEKAILLVEAEMAKQ
jgi:hypothetical protein